MRLQVLDDKSEVIFERDTALNTFLAPAMTVRGDVANILQDAVAHISQDHHVITSIRADISAVIGRIEHELGAHPAFTWAQTKLGNAAAHLEHYVKGTWDDPKQALVPNGTAFDVRGVLVDDNAPDPICPNCKRNTDGSFICDQGAACGAPIVRRGS